MRVTPEDLLDDDNGDPLPREPQDDYPEFDIHSLSVVSVVDALGSA